VVSSTCPAGTVYNTNPQNNYCTLWICGCCVNCQTGYYLKYGVCTESNPLCKTYNLYTDACLSCYAGYSLSNGQCVVTPNTSIAFCIAYSNGCCTQCSTGYYLNNNQCAPENPYCKTYVMTTGACLSCYAGYTLCNGLCIVA